MIHTSDCKKWLGADSIDTSHGLDPQERTPSIQRLGANPRFIRNNLYDMCRPTCKTHTIPLDRLTAYQLPIPQPHLLSEYPDHPFHLTRQRITSIQILFR